MKPYIMHPLCSHTRVHSSLLSHVQGALPGVPAHEEDCSPHEDRLRVAGAQGQRATWLPHTAAGNLVPDL